jgi:membrane protein required for colicin V production
MNPIDIGVIAIIVLSAIFAFARGFVREALSIVAWVGAAVIAIKWFDPVFALVDPYVKNPLLSQVIAGVGLFVVSLVVLTVITSYIARLVRFSALSPIDRTLGFIFGLARGAFIVCLAYLLLDLVPAGDRPPWIKDAKSAQFLQQGADKLRSFLPEQLKLKSASAVDELIQKIDPKSAADTEAKKAMRALATPSQTPAAKTDDAQAPNYRPGDRRDMNRLLGTQR